MSTDSNVVRLPHIPLGIYEPDHWSTVEKWKREKGWLTMPIRAPMDPQAVEQSYQARANQISERIKKAPLFASVDTPTLRRQGK